MALTNKIAIGNQYKIVTGPEADDINPVKITNYQYPYVTYINHKNISKLVSVEEFKSKAVLIEEVQKDATETVAQKVEQRRKKARKNKSKGKSRKSDYKNEIDNRKFVFRTDPENPYVIESITGTKKKVVKYTNIFTGESFKKAYSIWERMIDYIEDKKQPICGNREFDPIVLNMKDAPINGKLYFPDVVSKTKKALEDAPKYANTILDSTIGEAKKPFLSNKILLKVKVINPPSLESITDTEKYNLICSDNPDKIGQAIAALLHQQGIEILNTTIEISKENDKLIIVD